MSWRRAAGVSTNDGGWSGGLLPRELCVGERDEQDPGRQVMRGAVRRHRCVTPRKVLVVEIDRRQVIRLEVGDPGTRFGADDLLGLEAVISPGPMSCTVTAGRSLRAASEVTANVTDADARAAPAPAAMS